VGRSPPPPSSWPVESRSQTSTCPCATPTPIRRRRAGPTAASKRGLPGNEPSPTRPCGTDSPRKAGVRRRRGIIARQGDPAEVE